MNLPPHQRLAAPGKWPVVGEKAARTGDAAPWSVSVDGAVLHSRTWHLDALQALPQTERTVDIHCVTRWSRLAVPFSGVPLRTLLTEAVPKPSARFVRFVARSDRNHATSLPLALALDALIAFEADGAPLAPEHGGPVRIVTPGRYFYKSVKWLERIELLETDALGYWEAEAGYHNGADPWNEERYAAPNIPPRVLERALRTRDFSGLDLRGLQATGMDLRALIARSAKLRDAHFEGARLDGADFTGANLSNAHLNGASLVGADFTDADVEGAAFDAADLTEAIFAVASDFGATYDGAIRSNAV